jgi:hypothetical protein
VQGQDARGHEERESKIRSKEESTPTTKGTHLITSSSGVIKSNNALLSQIEKLNNVVRASVIYN